MTGLDDHRCLPLPSSPYSATPTPASLPRFGAAPVGALSGVVVPKGPPYAVAALQAEARDGACVLRWPSPNDGGDPITEYVVDVKVPLPSDATDFSLFYLFLFSKIHKGCPTLGGRGVGERGEGCLC